MVRLIDGYLGLAATNIPVATGNRQFDVYMGLRHGSRAWSPRSVGNNVAGTESILASDGCGTDGGRRRSWCRQS